MGTQTGCGTCGARQGEAHASFCPRGGPRTFTVRSSDIAACPIQSLSPSHYREDGTCLCDEQGE